MREEKINKENKYRDKWPGHFVPFMITIEIGIDVVW